MQSISGPSKALAVFLLVLAVFAVSTQAKAEDSSFISTFVRANGGCNEQAPLLVFDFGARRSSAPFDKAAEEWTDDDVKTLKSEMARCVPNPNGFDISQEKQILKAVSGAILEARQSHQRREQQAAAARQMADKRAEAQVRRQQERQRRQEEYAALQELQSFSGHIMSQAERDRALQLKETAPRVAAQVDRLLMMQSTLERQAGLAQKREDEREQAAQRIKAEQARRAVEEARAQQEAEIAAEQRRDEFAKALPVSCKDAQKGESDIETGNARKNFERAAALAEAGDTKAACASFNDYASKLEQVRAGLVECTKALDTNLDDLAREEAARALGKATEIYGKQKMLKQKAAELSCR